MSMFVTLGPLKSMLVYVERTQGMRPEQRRKIAVKAVAIASSIGLIFVFAGKYLLDLFHLSLGAMSVSGGIILFLFSLRIVLNDAPHSSAHPALADDDRDIAAYPLAIPLIITPVGMVFLTTASATYEKDIWALAAVALVFLLIMVIDVLVLLFESRIAELMNPRALEIAERVFGVVLAAFAVQVFFNGLQDLGLLHLKH